MVAVARGSVVQSWRLRRMLRKFLSFDEARAALSGQACSATWPLAGPFEFYVVGLDASGLPAAFMIVSHRLHKGVDPMTTIDIPYVVATGPVPDVDAAADPIAFGVEATKLQRRVLQKLPFSREPVSIVGGFLEYVAVDKGGVSSRVLGGWFDRIGDRLIRWRPSRRRDRPSQGRRWRFGFNSLMFPTPRQFVSLSLACLVLVSAAHIAPMVPGMVYVERLYHGSAETTVETGSGSWTVWARPDLGKILTAPTGVQAAWAAFAHSLPTSTDHAEAARQWAVDNAIGCTIGESTEILLSTFEHDLHCNRGPAL